MYLFFYETPIGRIGIAETDSAIVHLYFDAAITPTDVILEETPLLREAANQLRQYFLGELHDFQLPLNPQGTPFMKGVWNALCQIPYGETRNYKQIAVTAGNPKACRAVGLCNNRNPIPIFIPCHRVIGTSGKLVGYAGGLAVKQFLLELEQQKHSCQ